MDRSDKDDPVEPTNPAKPASIPADSPPAHSPSSSDATTMAMAQSLEGRVKAALAQ